MTSGNIPARSYWFPTAIVILVLISIPFFLNLRLQKTQDEPDNSWFSTSSLQQARRALAAASSSNHVYVIGGINDNDEYVSSVEYSAINPDGTLGAWQTTAGLIEGRFYLAAVSINGYIYAIGGANGARGSDNIPIASVERAKILADGSLGPWQPENHLTTPRRGTKAVVHGNHIYAIGGYNGTFLRSIERAEIQADGSLSEWVLEKEQANIDRYIHSATMFRDNIYLLGGHVHNDNKVSYGDVESSRILEDGTLSPWVVEKTILKNPRFIASAFAINNYLYILGGHDGANRLHSVEVAPLTVNGHVGSWTFTMDLPSGRDGTAIVTHDNRAYVLGGIDNNSVLNTVIMAQQSDNGHLGFPK